MNEQLQEFVDSRDVALRVDRRRGIIRNVKILGTTSRNGRTYSSQAICQAAALYEGAKVNVNHPRGGPAGPRDYRDRIGVIRNVTARVDEGLFGDFLFNPKHPLAEQLLWDAEHAPQNVGLSHNVRARTSRRGHEVVVEEITTVESVDLVADPATTRGLFEQVGADPTTLTADGLRRTRPDLVEALLAESHQRITTLEEQVDRFHQADEQRHRRETVLRLLTEFELPTPEATDTDDTWQSRVVSEAFLETLLRADDEPAMRQLIRERVDLFREADDRRPTSREQNTLHAQHPGDVEAFVRGIC